MGLLASLFFKESEMNGGKNASLTGTRRVLHRSFQKHCEHLPIPFLFTTIRMIITAAHDDDDGKEQELLRVFLRVTFCVSVMYRRQKKKKERKPLSQKPPKK